MPPAFNLSQDQTLQFNLYAAILISPCEPIDLTQSEFILLISTSCELLLLCLELIQFRLSSLFRSSVYIPTLIGCFIWILKSFPAFAVAAVAAKRCALYRSILLRQSIFKYSFSPGCGGRIWTYDLRVMSPTSCQTAPPRVSEERTIAKLDAAVKQYRANKPNSLHLLCTPHRNQA